MTTPSHIGQYRIIRKIGAGGMGMVFLGEHMLLGRRAAIKTLLPTVAANHEIVERFFNEARATSAISDPGVIQVFDFGYHVDGTAYIVMELLEGEALSTRIERLGKLTLGDALRIARQVAGSLGVAHARGIVHRDLKPENIFLVRDAEAQGGERTKILDFGICKVASGLGDASVTQSGAMIGTPVYMSPEQCRGAGGVDHRSDVYAFGCLLFYMLTGRPPFDGDAPGELIVAHMQHEPPLASSYLAELPPAVDDLLLRCLAKSPDDRFQSMADLQVALGELNARLDSAELDVPTVKPAMMLGRGFRSMYDANLAIGSGASPETPATGLRARLWFAPTKGVSPGDSANENASARGSASAVVPDDDSLDLLIAPPRGRGVRIALASVAVVGVVIGLVATSFATYRDHGEPRAEHAQAALPVEAAPDRAPARPADEIVPPMPTQRTAAPPAAAPPELPAAATPAAATVVPDEVAPSDEESAPRARSSREIKKAVARPRPRPSAPARRPPSLSSPSSSASSPTPAAAASSQTEDLYDDR